MKQSRKPLTLSCLSMSIHLSRPAGALALAVWTDILVVQRFLDSELPTLMGRFHGNPLPRLCSQQVAFHHNHVISAQHDVLP